MSTPPWRSPGVVWKLPPVEYCERNAVSDVAYGYSPCNEVADPRYAEVTDLPTCESCLYEMGLR